MSDTRTELEILRDRIAELEAKLAIGPCGHPKACLVHTTLDHINYPADPPNTVRFGSRTHCSICAEIAAAESATARAILSKCEYDVWELDHDGHGNELVRALAAAESEGREEVVERVLEILLPMCSDGELITDPDLFEATEQIRSLSLNPNWRKRIELKAKIGVASQLTATLIASNAVPPDERRMQLISVFRDFYNYLKAELAALSTPAAGEKPEGKE